MSPCQNNTDQTRSTGLLCLLWFVPLVTYMVFINRWSLSGDEFYTYVDSLKPLDELFSFEPKPLYYLICHALLKLNLPWPIEFQIRLPAAVAASLAPPSFYLLLRKSQGSTIALLAAVIAMANPWLFELSQMARFYTLAFLFASISVLALYRWFLSPKDRGWLVLYIIAGLLATVSHTPAAIVFPAGLIAFACGCAKRNLGQLTQFSRRYGVLLLGLSTLCLAMAAYLLKHAVAYWWNSEPGQFGNYSVLQILAAMALYGGISGWALSLLPLVRRPATWTPDEIFLTVLVLMSTLPLLALVPFGGGVAAKYLMFALPGMFILAAMHWADVDRVLKSWGVRLALGVAVLSVNLPYLASVARDGDHYDYRGIAIALESLDIPDPIIVASSNQMLGLYYGPEVVIDEMGTFEQGVPRALLQEKIDQSVRESRPLVLVSRENRMDLSPADQMWLFERFALLRTIESGRFDHRRFRMAIYEFRPMRGTLPNASGTLASRRLGGLVIDANRDQATLAP